MRLDDYGERISPGDESEDVEFDLLYDEDEDGFVNRGRRKRQKPMRFRIDD
jgi:hypothetical protein